MVPCSSEASFMETLTFMESLLVSCFFTFMQLSCWFIKILVIWIILTIFIYQSQVAKKFDRTAEGNGQGALRMARIHLTVGPKKRREKKSKET